MAHQGYPRRRFIELGASILTMGVAAPAFARDADLAIIVHGRNREPLAAAEVEAIFRTARRYWSNGDPIVAFNLVPGSTERTEFDQAVLKLSPAATARYWIDRKIRGGAPPPRTAPNANVLLNVVASLPTAIGYVSPELLRPDVRVVAWVKNAGVVSARGLAPASWGNV